MKHSFIPPFGVANYFIEKGIRSGKPINHGRLQLILFIAYAARLVEHNEVLLNGGFQYSKCSDMIMNLETYKVLVKTNFKRNPIDAVMHISFPDYTKPYGEDIICVCSGVPKPPKEYHDFLDNIWNEVVKLDKEALKTVVLGRNTPFAAMQYLNAEEGEQIPDKLIYDWWSKE